MSTRRPPRRLSGLLASAGLVAVVLTACGGDDGGETALEPGEVEVDDNFFRPESTRITTGETVTWRWVGEASHNVVHDGTDEFKSKTQADGTFEHTFEAAGEYSYVCTLHTGMEGTVVVSDG